MRLVSRAALALAGLALVATLLTALLGYRPVVISSGSMTPALHVGDVVISRSEPAATLRPGDVVTFHDPGLAGRLVTHRVVRIASGGAGLTVTTRGDANRVSESWTIAANGSVGVAAGHVPYAGWWYLLLHTGFGRVGLVLLLCAWAAAECLSRARR